MVIKNSTYTNLNTVIGSASGCFSVAVNHCLPGSVTEGVKIYESQQVDGGLGGCTELGGDSMAVTAVQPSYYPVATKGAECGAHVSALSWADSNLFAGYEYIVIPPDPADSRSQVSFFVTGLLNSTKTQANDPFGKTEVLFGSCWAGDYTIGLNPFA